MSTRPTDSANKSPSNSLHSQIAQYSLVAAVAGVSMLALAQPAAGEVVVTKKTIPIPLAPVGAPEPVKISMANNGMNDFTFELNSVTVNSTPERSLISEGVTRRNRVMAMGDLGTYAAQLQPGRSIFSSYGDFSPNVGVEASVNLSANSRYFRGFWGGNLKNVYLGVRFPIDGKPHYGWIRLTVTTSTQPQGPFMSATITAYAYETVPNKAIVAGSTKSTAEVRAPHDSRNQPEPSLGMLALGADGVPLWRREETLPSR